MQLYWAQLKGQSLNSYQTTNEKKLPMKKKKNFHNHLVTLYPHHFNRLVWLDCIRRLYD